MKAGILEQSAQTEPFDFAVSPEEFAKLPLEARICAQLVHNEKLRDYVEDLSKATEEIIKGTGSEHTEVTSAMRKMLGSTDHHANLTEVDQNEGGRRMVPTQAGLEFLHREIDKLR